jgi:hypothetical protein
MISIVHGAVGLAWAFARIFIDIRFLGWYCDWTERKRNALKGIAKLDLFPFLANVNLILFLSLQDLDLMQIIKIYMQNYSLNFITEFLFPMAYF